MLWPTARPSRAPTGSHARVAIDTSVLLGLFDSRDVWHVPSSALLGALEQANLDLFYFDCVLALGSASVTALTGPNEPQGPLLTDGDGRFRFGGLPAGGATLIVGGAGFCRRQLRVDAQADETVTLLIELKPETGAVERIRVEGLEVTTADEATFLVEATGEQLSFPKPTSSTCWPTSPTAGRCAAAASGPGRSRPARGRFWIAMATRRAR